MNNAPANGVPVKHQCPPSEGIRDVRELEGHESDVVEYPYRKVLDSQVEIGRARPRRPDPFEEGSKAAFDRGPISEAVGCVGARPVGVNRVAQEGGEARPIQTVEGLEEGGGGLRDRRRVLGTPRANLHGRARAAAPQGPTEGDDKTA